MSQKVEHVVDVVARRLDILVAERCQISRSYAQKLIKQGMVTVNGRSAVVGQKLEVGDRLLAELPLSERSSLIAEDIPLKVVYEDQDVAVIDKPAGIVVHPAGGHRSGTLVNAILSRYPDLKLSGDLDRPGIVHRLDRDTSGLVVVARNDTSYASLTKQMKARSVTKSYLALVQGRLAPETGAIDAPIGRHSSDRKRMAVVSGGREARTEYQVLQYLDQHTLVEVTLKTGRTHQIRVHFAAIGHPVFGDPVYGQRSPLLARQFLHAHRLGFFLPSTGEYVDFSSDLPADLRDALAYLRGRRIRLKR